MNLRFTYQDRETLVQKTELPRILRKKLSIPTEGPLILTPYELEILTTTTLKAYTCHNKPQARQAIKKVLNKILAAGEELHNSPESQPTTDHLSCEPHPPVGKLSPSQISQLLSENWLSDTPGVQLCSNLSPGEVIATPIIKRAHIFLQALAKDGTRATAAGNLNLKFVSSMIDQMDYLDDYVEYLTMVNRVIKESDATPLETLRIVMEFADLIEIKKRRFQLTKSGRSLMQPLREESLYFLLFIFWFRKFNLAYGDRIMDFPEFQNCLGYSLYQLSNLDSGWQDIKQMCEPLMMPSLAEILPTEPVDFRRMLVEKRLLRNFELFGLVELKWVDFQETPSIFRKVVAFRKTGLLARFIGFEL